MKTLFKVCLFLLVAVPTVAFAGKGDLAVRGRHALGGKGDLAIRERHALGGKGDLAVRVRHTVGAASTKNVVVAKSTVQAKVLDLNQK